MLTPIVINVPLSALVSHPRNPRLASRADIVSQLALRMREHGFDPLHMLVVRPLGDGYEVVSGHHRVLAAHEAGLVEVPCCVRTMTDDEAYMALMLENVHGELTPLEEGMHALKSGLTQERYAAATGKARTTLAKQIMAARVAQRVLDVPRGTSDSQNLQSIVPNGTIDCNVPRGTSALQDAWRCLAEVHVASPWLWPAIVTQLLTEQWGIDATRRAVRPLRDIPEPCYLLDGEAIATAVVTGAMPPGDVAKMASTIDHVYNVLGPPVSDNIVYNELNRRLQAERPATLSALQAICHAIEQESAAARARDREAQIAAQQRTEVLHARLSRLRKSVSLEEWHTLAADEQHALLHLDPADVEATHFNRQDTAAIEWAQWSINHITGCQHTCSYCYARDIALHSKASSAFQNGFAPTLYPSRLLAARFMKVPAQAAQDARYRNVFAGSMADMFGRWIPTEWLDAIFREMRLAQDWRFLCLTKFPRRLTELDLPPNGWFGTTVDLQCRVKAAEDAFSHIKTGVRWLSVEPLLEPLTFEHLDYFDWIVIGGASASTQTPTWHPPYAWIDHLVRQARDAGCKVYFKTNLLGKRILELPFDAPLPQEEALPAAFKYLKTMEVANGLD